MIAKSVVIGAAKAAHEANKEYCELLGDNSQESWDDSLDWVRDSSIAGVEAIINKPSITADEQHEAWSEFKIKDGWVYGEKKDVEAKTHPCLVTYEELPVEQRGKDVLFGRVVRAYLHSYLEQTVPIVKVPLKSTNLAGYTYDSENEELVIIFQNGGQYKYFEVPSNVPMELSEADSAGKYFHSSIRNSYSFERLPE